SPSIRTPSSRRRERFWGADVTTRVPLRRLLQRQEGAEAVLTAVSAALGGPVAVEDADGRIVHGPAGDGAARVAVTIDDQVLAWGRGSERDAAVAGALG